MATGMDTDTTGNRYELELKHGGRAMQKPQTRLDSELAILTFEPREARATETGFKY